MSLYYSNYKKLLLIITTLNKRYERLNTDHTELQPILHLLAIKAEIATKATTQYSKLYF